MRSSFSLVSLCALLTLSAGCAPSNPGLHIDGVLAPPMGGLCTIDASSNVFLGSGVLDTLSLRGMFIPDPAAFGPRYVANFRVSNHLINLFSDRYPLRADPNVMHLLAADIEIRNIDGLLTDFGDRTNFPNPFRVAAGGTILSAASESPGLGITSVEIIPPGYAAQLGAMGVDGARLIASVRIIGRTTGDAAVQSAEYFFPIDICNSCLFFCAATAEDVSTGCAFGQDVASALPPTTVLPEGTCPCSVNADCGTSLVCNTMGACVPPPP